MKPEATSSRSTSKSTLGSKATISRLRVEDAEALQRNCYPEADLEEVAGYVTWCLHPARERWIVRLVAVVDGEAVANAQLTVWGETGEIGSVVVAGEFRRQGLARGLITALILKARERGLAQLEIQVRQDQPALLEFYERLGFRNTQAQQNGLSHPACPEPALRLRMQLRGR